MGSVLAGIGLWIGLAESVAALTCAPIPPVQDASIARCAEPRANGTVRIRREALRALAFDSEGLAVVFVAGQFYYVNRAGETAPTLRFDNGADDFVEGLARTVRNGKIGFIDQHLVEVIPARWDFAFPFQKGLAVVCTSCTVSREGVTIASKAANGATSIARESLSSRRSIRVKRCPRWRRH